MQLDLGRAMGRALAKSEVGVRSREGLRSQRPVLQLSEFPLTLDPSRYANARSSSNPSGSLSPLFAFRQLVDPVPSFTRDYTASGRSTEGLYGNIINGMTVTAAGDYARGVVARAREKFSNISFANQDGTIGSWRPVYATPEDWYDTSNADRFSTLELDLRSSAAADQPFVLLGGNSGVDALTWRIGESTQPLASKPGRIRLRVSSVELTRPWMSVEVFSLDDWYLSGQDVGYVSSGSPRRNNGVLPLLPTTVLIGLSATISASWEDADRRVLETAAEGRVGVALGPFVLSSPADTSMPDTRATVDDDEVTTTVPFLSGWLSALVPKAPQITAPDATE